MIISNIKEMYSSTIYIIINNNNNNNNNKNNSEVPPNKNAKRSHTVIHTYKFDGYRE